MTLSIANEQGVLPLPGSAFERDVAALAVAAGWKGDLSVAVVDDARIREVNRRFLGHDYETDVIAFPLGDDDGEVVVSAETAVREANERGVEPMAELLLYVVHGILHLLGHDDHDPEQAERMHSRSLDLLGEIGYANEIPEEERRGKDRG